MNYNDNMRNVHHDMHVGLHTSVHTTHQMHMHTSPSQLIDVIFSHSEFPFLFAFYYQLSQRAQVTSHFLTRHTISLFTIHDKDAINV